MLISYNFMFGGIARVMANTSTFTQHDRIQHEQIISDFLDSVNRTFSFVFKGGACLSLHYGGRAHYKLFDVRNGLNRRYADIVELDARGNDDIIPLVKAFCCDENSNRRYEVLKDTDLEQQCAIHYAYQNTDFKTKEGILYVNVSKRGCEESCVTKQHGHLVYTVEYLCELACNYVLMRNELRDLYDLISIYQYYGKDLSPLIIQRIRSTLICKDSQPDAVYEMMKFQNIPFVDNEFVKNAYLSVCEELKINVSWKGESKRGVDF